MRLVRAGRHLAFSSDEFVILNKTFSKDFQEGESNIRIAIGKLYTKSGAVHSTTSS
jgi:hypothetical protein